ncbi:MAG: hypothetical protein K2X11_06475 [Acetobacteraceae bacterium]|nr:hypothetical protein [Acetobacteraceae bacterium]
MRFAEVHEGDAPPPIAAIYAGLREAAGIPVVNLIWRHFATMPGVLEWAWAAARPAFAERSLDEGRAALGRLAPAGGPLLDLPEEARQAVAIYNRGNRTNLQILTALRLAIAGAATGGGRPDPVPCPPMLPALPPQPRIEALPPRVAATVRALAALHGMEGAQIPSLYLHLALWPDALPPLREALARRFGTGGVAALRDALLAEAGRRADRLLPVMTPPGPFPPAHRDAVLAVLAVFPGKLIAEMTAIGAMLLPE